jgi:alkanesulfonate monooxygenase SsuD/methylene tetrahydromethanopterin reductase-like flavin-dependent oxidoreductase (luciferase family)
VKLGLQIPDFTTPDGPARLGADLGTVARTADEAGFEFIAVMDHFFQIRAVGPAELVARYADACNLFQTPDLARKLDVLRGHCDAEGRDYDEITKTCYFLFDVGERGEKAAEVVDRLGTLAELGFQAAIGGVANVWQVTPLEVIASDVIPAVAGL